MQKIKVGCETRAKRWCQEKQKQCQGGRALGLSVGAAFISPSGLLPADQIHGVWSIRDGCFLQVLPECLHWYEHHSLPVCLPRLAPPQFILGPGQSPDCVVHAYPNPMGTLAANQEKPRIGDLSACGGFYHDADTLALCTSFT